MYPALAVLQTETNKSTRVLWVGSDDGLEADLVKRAGIAYLGIPAAGLHGVNILSIPKRLFKLAKGYIAAKKIIREYKPDVMFFTGGYVGFPVALAGRKIPSVLFVPDILYKQFGGPFPVPGIREPFPFGPAGPVVILYRRVCIFADGLLKNRTVSVHNSLLFI